MTENLDKGICGCPPPRHLSRFAKFLWICETYDTHWPLEDLVKLQTALECWDDFRVARIEGCAKRIERKAEEFAAIWLSSVYPGADSSKLLYPACLNNDSILSYPDSLEEWLIATGTPDPWGISDRRPCS